MAFFIKVMSVLLEYGMTLLLIIFVVKSWGFLFADIRRKKREIRSRAFRNNNINQNFE